WCIICDGYKVRNKRVAVLGHEDTSIQFCLELLNFTTDIVLLTNSEADGDHISPKGLEKLKAKKIDIKYGSIVKVKGKSGMVQSITLDTGEQIKADFIFNKQGYVPRSDVAAKLGVITEGEGFIKVDQNQKTNIEGMYAAGDVTHNSLHQILTAAHQGALAAVAINHDLFPPDQRLHM
ncbi:MAG TPA: NAD(P)/FAD-dependent oxidoreductase, partial [Candidatus Paceibacterota bacterium]|nr:NAD(P)/FAD-dependent oxidoreductase [Candidatus Paceibacterota bacterium]